ncbi:CARDB domain-containing protein [Chloroflexota bacterium]
MKKTLLWLRRCAAVALVITLFLVSVMPGSASAALTPSDYFSYTSDVQFSKTSVTGSESFNAIVSVNATCFNTLPWPASVASEASITGRIIAEHQTSGARVTLNSSYNLPINPFPNTTGESTSVAITVPLQFPTGSASGTYDVIAELVEAKVKVGFTWPNVASLLPSEQPAGIPITYTAGSSGGGFTGGGGGGLPPSTNVSVNGLTSTKDLTVSTQGIVQNSLRLHVTAADAFLDILSGTKMLTASGNAMSSLTASEVAAPSDPPAGKAVVLAVDFKPDGATFTPPITLAIDFDSASLPEGMAVEEVYIAYWDGSAWQALPSTLNMMINRVSAKVSHFTEFVVMGNVPYEGAPIEETPIEGTPPPPVEFQVAAFSIRGLSVTPEQPTVSQKVTISATLANTGSDRGSYTTVLSIDGVAANSTELQLDAGAEFTISFEITPEAAGTYEVDINGLTASFTVSEIDQEIITTAPPAEDQDHEPIAETPQEPSLPWFLNWWIIGGVAAVIVVVIGLVIYFVGVRRY